MCGRKFRKTIHHYDIISKKKRTGYAIRNIRNLQGVNNEIQNRKKYRRSTYDGYLKDVQESKEDGELFAAYDYTDFRETEFLAKYADTSAHNMNERG